MDSTTALDALRAAASALAMEPLETLSDAALGEDLIALEAVIARVEAERIRRLGAFDSRHAFENDNVWSSVTWLRRHCRMSRSAAAARVAVARTLPQLPAAQRAFADGDIGYQHAAVLTRLTEDVGVEAVRAHEEVLLDGAFQYDPAFVATVGRHLRECADPDGEQDEADEQHRSRWLRVSPTLDGVVYVNGRLDRDGGAIVMTALDSLMRPGGDAGGGSAPERRADAFVEIFRRQLDAGELPDRGGQRPHLTLTVSIDKLRGDHTAPMADLGWVGSIPMETARRLACDSAVTTVLVDAGGRPVHIGPERKVVPAHLRRALVIRDGGRCAGCGRPAAWCDAHHVVHLADGGTTTLANLVLLCRRCHVAVHEGRMLLRLTAEGRYELTAGGRGRRRLRRGPPISCAA